MHRVLIRLLLTGLRPCWAGLLRKEPASRVQGEYSMRFSPQTACIGLACFLAGASYDKLVDKLLPPRFDASATGPAGFTAVPRRGAEARLPTVMHFERSASGENPDNKTLLILSPVRNRGSSHHTPIGHFVELVDRLTHPKHLTSVALLEGDSNDDTWELMQQSLAALQGYCSVEALKRDFGPLQGGGDGGGEERHAVEIQLRRRQRLAKVRNWLLTVALRDHEYVLWLDSDLWEIPRDLVQQLMASQKDLVVPNCLVAGTDRTYDLNRSDPTFAPIDPNFCRIGLIRGLGSEQLARDTGVAQTVRGFAERPATFRRLRRSADISQAYRVIGQPR